MGKLTVFLVDDHAVVRLGLRTLLEDLTWVDIVGEAGTAAEAIAAVAIQQPNVVLMDIRLPDDSGVIACSTITKSWPKIRVIMLTSYSDDNLIMQAKQAGACCYILKQVGNQALVDALERMREGELNLDPLNTQKNITQHYQEIRYQRGGKLKNLTEREMRVLVEIANGKTNPQTASTMVVSEQTVCNDVDAIIRKLEVDNRFEAAIYALQHKVQLFLPERDDEAVDVSPLSRLP